ncbi:MAG: transporter substrate-binding domain-containing protein [Halofilum sp. (in: g-proteobacteria)]
MIKRIGFLSLTVAILGLFTGVGPVQSADADLLERIKDRGELSAGTEARFPPFEFVEDGEIVGYSADMMDIIMEDLPGVELNRRDVPWQGILPGLEQEAFDYIITSVTMTSQRCDKYALSYPIADASFAFLKRAGDDRIQAPEDVAGLVIGTQTGSAQLQGVRDFSDELESEGGEGVADIRTYTDFNEAYADLAAGRVDAVGQSLPNLLDVAKKRPEVFEVASGTFGPPTYFTWAARNDADSESLSAFFNEQLAELHESGKMAELQEKWFGQPMDIPMRDMCPEVKAADEE